jgi:hypothetical protein
MAGAHRRGLRSQRCLRSQRRHSRGPPAVGHPGITELPSRANPVLSPVRARAAVGPRVVDSRHQSPTTLTNVSAGQRPDLATDAQLPPRFVSSETAFGTLRSRVQVPPSRPRKPWSGWLRLIPPTPGVPARPGGAARVPTSVTRGAAEREGLQVENLGSLLNRRWPCLSMKDAKTKVCRWRRPPREFSMSRRNTVPRSRNRSITRSGRASPSPVSHSTIH